MVIRFKADPSISPVLDSNLVDNIPISVIKVLSELDFINEFKRPPGH